MAILENHFYHSVIRKYNLIFGALFDNIKIKKGNQITKVPIANELKTKQMVRRDVDDPNAVMIQSQLPRMSYMMTGFERDPARQTNRLQALTIKDLSDPNNPSAKHQYNRVPFKFNFDLNIKTKYYDDMLQIIEQIVVWFSDNIEITVVDNPDLDAETTLSISLQSTTPENDFEGIMDQGSSFETVLSFVVDGWLYKPTSAAGLINHITINYYDIDTSAQFDVDSIPEA